MSRSIPLIRSAALLPMMRWMRANGRPVEKRLAAANLSYVSLDVPEQPVPALNVATFFRNAGRDEGPDIGCRVVSETSILELAMIGKVALGARSPREAMLRVAAALPYHCSHEHIGITSHNDHVKIQEGWLIHFDDETLHIVQQFFVSIMRVLCGLTGVNEPLLDRIELVPHPEAGLDHLRPWFGPMLAASTSRVLTIVIKQRVAEAPFHNIARDRMTQLQSSGLVPMAGDGTLAASARAIIPVMLEAETPTVEDLALAAGLSIRTFQRRLSEEGVSFSALLEDARRDAALEGIKTPRDPLTQVALAAGYSRQSALTRAVRRWTGRSPSHLRSMRGE